MITSDCIKSVRPGFGMSPKYFEAVVGSLMKFDINKYAPVRESDFYAK